MARSKKPKQATPVSMERRHFLRTGGPNPIAFQTFARYLRAPGGEMPPYTVKVMSDQDVADVYAFLRALPPAPPLSSLPLLQP